MENRRSLVLRQVNASCRRWNFPMERVPGVEVPLLAAGW